ncbi:cytochrome o ubiquinol oxidase subunit IV [Aquicoccus sp. SCR17]|nr:cytochrome o ubiquinol oxidase subunit IV [Carideicomes alvinocaridis]
MNTRDTYIPKSENQGAKREFVSYIKGGIASLVLTLAAFGLVAFDMVSGLGALAALGGLAIVQIVIQFRYFLHIDLQKSHRDDLQLILFTGLIVSLMIGGTLWILFDQHARM